MRRAVFASALAFGVCACNAILGTEEGQGRGGDAASDPDGGSSTSEVGAAEVGSCTGNLDENADHCGYCGHSCGGANCVGGVCQVRTLCQDVSRPRAIAVGPKAIAWIELTPGTSATYALAIAPVVSGAIDCVKAPRVASFDFIPTLAMNATHVFAASVNQVGTTAGSIGRAPLDAKAGTGMESMMDGDEGTSAFDVDDQLLVWCNAGTQEIRARSLLPLGAPTQLVDKQLRPRYVRVAGNDLFWGRDSPSGTIEHSDLTGGARRVVASYSEVTSGIAFTKSDVLWLGRGAKSIYHAPRDGSGSGTLLLQAQESPDFFRADDLGLVWVEQNGGRALFGARSDGTGRIKLVEGTGEDLADAALHAGFVYAVLGGSADEVYRNGAILKIARP